MSDKYNRIIAALRKASLQSLESSFERAVDDEARALSGLVPAQGGYKGRRDNGRKALETAQAFYADELSEEFKKYDGTPLDAPGEELPGITPTDILSYRRKATVWAIARLMFDEGMTSEDIGDDDASRVTETIADKKNWRSK